VTTPKTAALIEDVQYLLDQGVDPVEIPERFGLKPETLHDRLRRNDASDLAVFFPARPHGANTHPRTIIARARLTGDPILMAAADRLETGLAALDTALKMHKKITRLQSAAEKVLDDLTLAETEMHMVLGGVCND